MVGGTAVALQIGHRRSIDFDLFREKPFRLSDLMRDVHTLHPDARTLFKGEDQIHYIVDRVKLTFFHYPYPVTAEVRWDDVMKMPDLLTLAAMKAFALGRRSKWKDYVDLYFILRSFHTFEEICRRAEGIFGGVFSTKLFKMQLGYFEDIDYNEEVEYLPGFEVSDDEVKAFLMQIGTKAF